MQIVDAAMAEANRNAGTWLACRIGCTECCMGPFPITQLDAIRLRAGLGALEESDPARASRVRQRARAAVEKITPEFPGDASTGVLSDDEEAEERFATLAEDDPCPALDPDTGDCDLYDARPLTCRTFGPAIRWGGDALGICELNFKGAADEEIAACEVNIEDGGLEAELLAGLPPGETIVAFALAAERS